MAQSRDLAARFLSPIPDLDIANSLVLCFWGFNVSVGLEGAPE